jgi:hypothetical protein
MMRWILVTSFVGMLCSAHPGCAQYRLLPGQADEDGCLPTTPARICSGATGTEHCYAFPSTKDYIFGLDPEQKNVGKLDGQMLTLFSATFSGCGSGLLTSFALLAEHGGEFADLLPLVQLTDQSEYRLWNLPQISTLPVLVTADFIWNFKAGEKSNFTQETHFAAHRYSIQAFVFDPTRRAYVERVHFDTKKKYPGLDAVESIRVLEPERPQIIAQLMQKSAH